MCLKQQQTFYLKHRARKNTSEQQSWKYCNKYCRATNHMSVLEVKGLSHLDVFCSLPLCVCGAWLPLPGVGTICMMLKLIATGNMYRVLHFVVRGEANLQYL